MNNYKNISLFDGLNSLRFFAAFLVVLHHAESIRKKNVMENLEWFGLFRNGDNAVTFFFVLSGFLITYLLLKETSKTGTISIKNFYIKRMLRIWPLYFLLVIIGTLIVPEVFGLLHINYVMPYSFGQVWFYFVFFLPGIVSFIFGHHLLEPLWSIGIEEVFYLIWAPLFKIAKRRIVPILLAIIIIKVVLLILAQFWIKDPLFVYTVNIFRFEAMAIGGLGACYIFNRRTSLSDLRIYNKPVQIIIYTTLIAFLIFQSNIQNVIWQTIFFTPIVSSILIDLIFLYLIVGVSLIDNNIIKLKNKVLSYLGEISYGIYMYHVIVISAVIQFLKGYLNNLSPFFSAVIFYTIVILAVILISAISKIVFEDYFLKLKKKLN
jgi:peptidoglycan/LPS O-acetylase OafA/YrhL